MAKLVLTDVSNLLDNSGPTSINSNNAAIETALENTLSRDGTAPNQMQATLDMNSHRIINLPAANSPTEPVRKAEIDAISAGNVFAGPAGFIVSDGGTNFASRSLVAGSGITITNTTGGGNPTISLTAGTITNSLLAAAPNNTVKGNVSGSSATPTDLTTTQLTTLINAFTSGLKGAVPSSGGGTANFLRADASWAIPPTATLFSSVANGIVAASGGGKVNYLRADGAWHDKFGYISTDDFGCVGDGVTDDSAAFATVVTYLNANGGACRFRGTLKLGQEYTFTGSNITLFGLTPQDGVTIKNGTAFGNGLFQFVDCNNIRVENLKFDGTNNTTPAVGTGGFLMWNGTQSRSALIENFVVRDCLFKNCLSPNWVQVIQNANAGNTYVMRHFSITNCQFHCDVGYDSTNNSFIFVFGNTLTGSGSDDGCIQNGVIAFNRGYGVGMSGFYNGQYNQHDIAIFGNVLDKMGNNTTATDFSYTIAVYASQETSRAPYNITIAENTSNGNHACAVYVAGARNVSVTGNVFTDTRSSSIYPTLPHGFTIAFNGAQNITCTGNTITGPGGIYQGTDKDRPSTDVIAGNSIVVTTISGFPATGILLNCDNEGLATDDQHLVLVANNNVKTDSNDGICLVMNPTYQFGRVMIIGNTFKSGWMGIYIQPNTLAKEIILANNSYSGGLLNYSALVAVAASPVFVYNETHDFSSVVAGSSGGVIFDSCTKLTIDGLNMMNKTNSGVVLSLVNAQGRTSGISFPGCTSTFAQVSSLGLAAPSYSGIQGDKVQNLNPTVLGSGGYATTNQKYILDHWTCTSGTTWVEQRYLTGS